jgi:hypothetical protein
MTQRNLGRERLMWTAAVAILATSLAWLAVVNFALILSAHGANFSAAWLVVRTIARVAWALISKAWPLVPAAAAAAALILLATSAPRAGVPVRQEVRRV